MNLNQRQKMQWQKTLKDYHNQKDTIFPQVFPFNI